MPSLRTLPKELALFAKYHLRHPAAPGPVREEDLGQVELGFDIERYLESLRDREDRYRIREEARVTHEGRSLPILSLESRGDVASKTVLVIAGIHGNEHAGLLAVPRILDRHDDERVRLVVIAPANPVGATACSRYNAAGYDINRDFVRFETDEARVVRDVFERVSPDFVISLHEGPQDATFMFANRHVDDGLARRALAALEAGGTPLATRDYFGLRLTPPGLSPSSAIGRVVHAIWARSLSMMASITWSERRGVPEVVLESAWRDPDAEARVRPHVDLVGAVVRAMGSTT